MLAKNYLSSCFIIQFHLAVSSALAFASICSYFDDPPALGTVGDVGIASAATSTLSSPEGAEVVEVAVLPLSTVCDTRGSVMPVSSSSIINVRISERTSDTCEIYKTKDTPNQIRMHKVRKNKRYPRIHKFSYFDDTDRKTLVKSKP